MAFNKFTYHIVFRILLILCTLVSIAFLFRRGDLFFTLTAFVVLLVVQVITLIQYVNKTNLELSKFILALRDTDYTTKFPKAENESFEILYHRFQHTLEAYKAKETKYEAQFLFIQELIDNIETGLLALDQDQKVVLINRMARQIRTDYRFNEDQPLMVLLEGLRDSQMITGNNLKGKKIDWLVSRSTFKLLDKTQTIFTFKDISSPLETREIESWQKLIRILAHEIINSLTPITSLSETTLLMLKNSKYGDNLPDIALSLHTIKDRSEGLLTFMEHYRQLVKIPTPKPEMIEVKSRIQSILHLFQKQLTHIAVREIYDYDSLYVDPILFDQMIVNLLTNSVQALQDRKDQQVVIQCQLDSDGSWLEISDNGVGMDDETKAQALIPFFTTKPTGSGIGLSLIQQIMNLHHGRIEIESEKDHHTSIRLLFDPSIGPLSS